MGGHLKIDCSVRNKNVDSYRDETIEANTLDELTQEREPLLRRTNATETEVESQLSDEPCEARTSDFRNKEVGEDDSETRKMEGSAVKPLSSWEDVHQDEVSEEKGLGGEAFFSAGESVRKKWKQSMIQTSTVNVSTAEYSLNSGEGYQEIGCCKQRSLPNQPTPIAQNEYQTSILESSKPSSDPEGKKSSESLPAEHQYDILCVHIETIKKSSSTETELTQIGCSVLNMNVKKRADDFFRAVKPSELDRLLDDYAIGGDLLQALHMTREDNGTFLFRGNFLGGYSIWLQIKN